MAAFVLGTVLLFVGPVTTGAQSCPVACVVCGIVSSLDYSTVTLLYACCCLSFNRDWLFVIYIYYNECDGACSGSIILLLLGQKSKSFFFQPERIINHRSINHQKKDIRKKRVSRLLCSLVFLQLPTAVATTRCL